MKKFLLFCLFILFCLPCYPKTLQAGISYTIEEAKIEAFKDVPTKIDISQFKEYFVDKNYQENLKAIKKGKTKFRDRRITLFSDGNYAIRYKNDTNHSYYYNSQGKFEGIDFDYHIKSYHAKTLTYDEFGNLVSVCLQKAYDEQFIFHPNQKLGAHWIGENCYNEKGELVMTRKTLH